MRILDRYLGRTVAGAAAMVMLFLLMAFSFFGFLDELNDVGRGSYSVLAAAEFTLLKMPVIAYQLFPVAALIGTLLGLGTLVGNSEMIVIRAAGVSLARTIISVMKAGLVLTFVAILIGEFLAPQAEQDATNLRSLALSNQIALKTRNGFWARDGNSFINIRSILPGDRVRNIYIYEFDAKDRLRVSTHAKSAEYANKRWLLNDIKQTIFSGDTVSVRRIKHAVWESLLRPELIGLVIINPDSLSTWELVNYIHYLKQNSQNTQRYEQALWGKIVYPLATAAMVFLAIPMVFASARAASVGGRIMIGSLIGIVFHIVNQAAGHLGVVLNLNPVVSVVTPTLVVVIAGFVLLRRVS